MPKVHEDGNVVVCCFMLMEMEGVCNMFQVLNLMHTLIICNKNEVPFCC